MKRRVKTMEDAEKLEFEDVILTFDALAARLDSLDGMYAWNDEIELIRKALEKAGY